MNEEKRFVAEISLNFIYVYGVGGLRGYPARFPLFNQGFPLFGSFWNMESFYTLPEQPISNLHSIVRLAIISSYLLPLFFESSYFLSQLRFPSSIHFFRVRAKAHAVFHLYLKGTDLSITNKILCPVQIGCLNFILHLHKNFHLFLREINNILNFSAEIEPCFYFFDVIEINNIFDHINDLA